MYSFHCGCSCTYLVCVWHTVLGTLRDPVSHILALILGAVALDDSSLQLFQMEALLLPQPANTPSFEPLCSRLVLPSPVTALGSLCPACCTPSFLVVSLSSCFVLVPS